MTLGKGFITNISQKQNVNTRSSTKLEIVGVDNVVAGPVL
jgi:hypothetical protein